MFASMICGSRMNMGQPGSKTGSQGQILGKILVKALNVMVLIGSWPNLVRLFYLNDIKDKFKYGSPRVKNQVTRSNLRKTLLTL